MAELLFAEQIERESVVPQQLLEVPGKHHFGRVQVRVVPIVGFLVEIKIQPGIRNSVVGDEEILVGKGLQAFVQQGGQIDPVQFERLGDADSEREGRFLPVGDQHGRTLQRRDVPVSFLNAPFLAEDIVDQPVREIDAPLLPFEVPDTDVLGHLQGRTDLEDVPVVQGGAADRQFHLVLRDGTLGLAQLEDVDVLGVPVDARKDPDDGFQSAEERQEPLGVLRIPEMPVHLQLDGRRVRIPGNGLGHRILPSGIEDPVLPDFTDGQAFKSLERVFERIPDQSGDETVAFQGCVGVADDPFVGVPDGRGAHLDGIRTRRGRSVKVNQDGNAVLLDIPDQGVLVRIRGERVVVGVHAGTSRGVYDVATGDLVQVHRDRAGELVGVLPTPVAKVPYRVGSGNHDRNGPRYDDESGFLGAVVTVAGKPLFVPDDGSDLFGNHGFGGG